MALREQTEARRALSADAHVGATVPGGLVQGGGNEGSGA